MFYDMLPNLLHHITSFGDPILSSNMNGVNHIKGQKGPGPLLSIWSFISDTVDDVNKVSMKCI